MTTEKINALPNYRAAIEQCRAVEGCEVVYIDYVPEKWDMLIDGPAKQNYGYMHAGKMVVRKDSEGKPSRTFETVKQGLEHEAVMFRYTRTEETPHGETVSLGAEYVGKDLRYELGSYEQMVAKAEGEAPEGYELDEEWYDDDFMEVRITNYKYVNPMEREQWAFGSSVFRCRPKGWVSDGLVCNTLSTEEGEYPEGGSEVVCCVVKTELGTEYIFSNEKVGDPGDRMVSFVEENDGRVEFKNAVYTITVNVEGSIVEMEYSGEYALDGVWDCLNNLPMDDVNNVTSPPAFIQDIDWDMLRNQKLTLLHVMESAGTKDVQVEDLQGILNLIDSIQDYAADDLNMGVVFLEEE